MEDLRARKRPPNLLPIWAAMCTSQLVIAGMTAIVPPAQPQDLQMAGLLGAVALGSAVMSLLWGRLVLPAQPPQQRWLMRWALAEACTLVGLVSWAVAGALVPAVAPMIAGFLLIVVQFPGRTGGEGE
jgi:hypothetical protein